MITIPSLNNVTDILDTDMVMVTQQSGQSYKISGSELNKRGKIIIANSTTITGTPLKAGSSVRVYFTVDLTAANASTTLQLNYNNVNYYVKAPKDGTLINFVATNLGGSPAVYKYLQKYTTLELLFDGTQFVIIGNPVVLSSADYTICADGYISYKKYQTIAKIMNPFQEALAIYEVPAKILISRCGIPQGTEVNVSVRIGESSTYTTQIDSKVINGGLLECFGTVLNHQNKTIPNTKLFIRLTTADEHIYDYCIIADSTGDLTTTSETIH